MKTRKLILVAVPAALASILAVDVGSASAAESNNANCVGALVSAYNQFGRLTGMPGLGGRGASEFARNGGLGYAASTNTCTVPPPPRV
jgi:hypothetical protein